MSPSAPRTGPGGQRLLPWLALALSLLLIGWGWHWFSANFERRLEPVDTGFSAAARRNPYLAAERFLRRLGIDAESVTGRTLLRDLPPPTTTLLVRGLGPLNAARQRALADWLDAGGTLICEAMEITAADEPPRDTDFLGAQGIILRGDGLGPEDDGQIAGDEMADDGDDGGDDGGGDDTAITVAFDARYYLDDRSGLAMTLIGSDARPRVLQRPVGAGQLIVLSDTGFMTNQRIGEPDHALFLARLIAGTPAGEQVGAQAGTGAMPRTGTDGRQAPRLWIIYDSAVADLGTLLWRAAPQALFASAVLVLLILWRLGRRLGPLLAVPDPDQRDLLTHLGAAGDFLWRHGRGEVHLTATRRRIEGAWLRRHPTLRAMATDARAHWLANRTGLGAAAITAALYQGHGETDPLTIARTLQRIWLALGHRQ